VSETTSSGPHQEYEQRLAARRTVTERLEARHIKLGNLQLAVAAWVAIFALLAFGRHLFSGLWLIPPVVLFAALAVVHSRILRQRRRAERAAAFYEKGLARLEDRWHGLGEGGVRFNDPAHPYAEDLDIFGTGSLFELLSTTRLRTGEETLARWLLAPAPPQVIRVRQEAVADLQPRLDFREDLALLGEDLRSGVDPGQLSRWAEQPIIFDSPGLRIGAVVLACLAVAGLALWAALSLPEGFLAVLAVESIFFFKLRQRISRVTAAVGEPAYGLALFSEVLERLEREPFSSPHLLALRKELEIEGVPPSRRIARLNRLMELLDSSDHWLIRLLNLPLLYRVQLAFAIEGWRKKCGPHVRGWLAAVGEIEALCAFANYAYEHPADVFPEFAEDGPCFEGDALAHPLLSESRAVRNDLSLSGDLRAMVVSGSNMSGKSTLLRTVGINAVLALAGAPVRARRLRLSPVAVGASIRTIDSLRGGTSRFYTEITRLRKLLDLTKGPLPLLFLLDELLQGTNSHDRRIGAEAVVHGLLDRGAIGLVTTHDLALAHIADTLAPRANNVHFEDHLENGKITFDYALRPGVVRKSNALELMRSVGLEV
jgi:hypothetical protein